MIYTQCILYTGLGGAGRCSCDSPAEDNTVQVKQGASRPSQQQSGDASRVPETKETHSTAV